jgi:pyruvate,water dikinase
MRCPVKRYVFDLSHDRALRESIAGGKGAKLARLLRKGFRVPPGFIISTDLLNRLVGEGGVPRHHGRNSENKRAVSGDNLRDSVLRTEFPPEVSREIGLAFRRLGGPVAVRSSLVGEDGSAASFAGQLDSFLDVGTEASLLDAIRKCYASLFSDRFEHYLVNRAGGGNVGGPYGISMAILVQRMIDGRPAGIAFSADPDTGRFCIIIEAVAGPCDALAGGRARPDRYVMDSQGMLAEMRPADDGTALLDRRQILELGTIVRGVSREMMMPQDVEWVLDRDGFCVLQSRPITSLAGKHLYSRRLAADMAPGLIKPLYFTTNIRDMARNVFGRVFTEALGPRDIDYTRLVSLIRSRVFADITLFAELFGHLGLPINLFEVMARDDAAIHKRPRFNRRLLRHIGRIAALVLRYGWIRKQAEAFLTRHQDRLDMYRSADWSGRPPATLLKEVIRLRAFHGETQWYMWLTAINMTARNKMLSKFVSRRSPDTDAVSLLAGFTGLKSLEPNLEIQEIAGRLRAIDPESIPLLQTGDDGAVRARLNALPGGRDLIDRFDDFMARYGHLSASGTDFTVSPWAEHPEMIWRNIARMVAESQNAEAPDARSDRERARKAVMRNSNLLQRTYFNRLLKGTITYLRLRERISFIMSEDAYQMRRLYLAIGKTLQARGDLESPEDLFFLEFDELEELVDKKLDSAIARERIKARSTGMEEDAQVELDDVICGEGEDLTSPAPPAEVTHLEGIAGSAGIIRGYARIVCDPMHAPGDFKKHDVLVVPFMDVGWTPLFSVVGGIVAETGGQLSHSAIVAREYGLPAVVGVRGATNILQDGQPVTVDGGRGRIYLGHV